jgi:hypothetical protein
MIANVVVGSRNVDRCEIIEADDTLQVGDRSLLSSTIVAALAANHTYSFQRKNVLPPF